MLGIFSQFTEVIDSQMIVYSVLCLIIMYCRSICVLSSLYTNSANTSMNTTGLEQLSELVSHICPALITTIYMYTY